MEKPKVSLIVPVYNVKEFLPACVKSIKNQYYDNLEIIFIDDGSTDGSGAEIEKLAKKLKNAQVFHTENHGLSAARNFGLDHATGDFIMFLDSDDELAENAINRMMDVFSRGGDAAPGLPRKIDGLEGDFSTGKARRQDPLEKTSMNIIGGNAAREKTPEKFNRTNTIDIVIGNFAEKMSDGRKIKFSASRVAREMNPEEALKDMLLENDFMVSAWAKMYRADLFEKDPTNNSQKIRYPDGKIYEDVGTTYRLLMNAKKIVYTPDIVYYYRAREDSISRRKFSRKNLDLIDLTDQMCSDIDKKYPSLKKVTKLRRLRARLSILHMLPGLRQFYAFLKNHR